MSSAPRSILVVDDVPDNVAVLFDFLRDRGFSVLVSESGTHALEDLPLIAPDLILLDVMMPGIDGFETCRRLKADARFADVPVFFMTALGDPIDRVRGLQLGAADYITKPIFPEEVLARIVVHLELRERNRELALQNEKLDAAIQQRVVAEHALRDSLDRAVLVVDGDGRPGFVAASAAALLRRHCAGYDGKMLPAAIAAWLGQPKPDKLTIASEWGGLELERTPAAPGSSLRLVHIDEKPLPPSPAMLLPLGLTPREAEILFWIAHGKTSPEVAAIVGNAPATVKKHVGSITAKLGVDSRLAAALKAMEVLGLHSPA